MRLGEYFMDQGQEALVARDGARRTGLSLTVTAPTHHGNEPTSHPSRAAQHGERGAR